MPLAGRASRGGGGDQGSDSTRAVSAMRRVSHHLPPPFPPRLPQGLDIGPKSIDLLKATLSGAKTVIWNGPMGVFEFEAFSKVGGRAAGRCVQCVVCVERSGACRLAAKLIDAPLLLPAVYTHTCQYPLCAHSCVFASFLPHLPPLPGPAGHLCHC